MPETCPSSTELRRLVDGALSDVDAQPLELHLDRCQACQQTLLQIAADETFWDTASEKLASDKIGGLELDRAIETLKQQSRAEAEEIGEAIELKLSFIERATEPGTIGRLQHYDILRVAGRGGMGIVLKAFDRSLRRIVAVKLLAPHLAGNGQARKRFIREGRAAAGICHEHVVTIHAVEESPPFLVMQYVHGETLEDRIHRNGSLTVRESVRIALQIAQGLVAAHAQGVVHRDIKPANILLENDVARVRITDFGLARAVDDASMTQSGVVAGTPQYMAPEQASGDAIDERADLFSLGSVLYTMLAGHAPFRATTAMGVLKRLCDNTARPIREINPETPDWLVVIVNRLHAKRPADRFHDAKEVVSVLERGLSALQNGTAPPSLAAAHTQQAPSSTTSLTNDEAIAGGSPRKASPPRQIYFPMWLFFAVVAAIATMVIPEAGMIGAVIAIAAFLTPRLFPEYTSRWFVDSTSDSTSHSATDSERSLTPVSERQDEKTSQPHWLFSMGMVQLLGWLLLWVLPAVIWMNVFFVQKYIALHGSYSNAREGDRLMCQAAIIVFVTWLIAAVLWFRRRHADGSFSFRPSVRSKGILTLGGLAAMSCVCGYKTWESDVYLQAKRRHQWVSQNSVRAAVPSRPSSRLIVNFDEPRENMYVIVDAKGSLFDVRAANSGQIANIATGPATYPWRAMLGQSKFASGEVTFEAGIAAEIQVPGPQLKNLIAGRWESENSGGGYPGMAMGGVPRIGGAADESNSSRPDEVEFSGVSATLLRQRRTGRARWDWEFQIDESVTPALITFTNSAGEKLAGIIRFETADVGPPSRRTGMGGYGAPANESTRISSSMKDRLVICLSSGMALRPWQFKTDAAQKTELLTLTRSKKTEALRKSVTLTPLDAKSPPAWILESVEAWSQELEIPIDRKNSVGIDLTLVPPAHFYLSPADVSTTVTNLLPDPRNKNNSILPAVRGEVLYPFVISTDVVSKTQFRNFVKETGYVTDAQKGEETVTGAPETPTLERSEPEDFDALSAAMGGWAMKDKTAVWIPGLSWETTKPSHASNADEGSLALDDVPATVLSVRDATAFCEWLSGKENRLYRLPTIQEWTVAAELGRLSIRHGNGKVAAENASSAQKRKTPELRHGEWTAQSSQVLDRKCHIVAQWLVGADMKFFSQFVAPDTFRASEIGFRVVTELQTAAADNVENRKPEVRAWDLSFLDAAKYR